MSRPARGGPSADLIPLFVVSALLVVGTVALDRFGPALPGSETLRVVVAGAFLLFVPGYAVVAALFSRAGQLSLLERGVFSVGASLALVTLLGILLDRTPWGLELWSVLLGQLLVVGVLLAAAEAHRQRLPVAERAAPYVELRSLLARVWRRRDAVGGGSRAVEVLLVIAVLASVGATAYAVAVPLPSQQFTELSVTGPDGTAAGLPSNATTGETVELLVAVRNNEHERSSYGLQTQLRANGSASVVGTDTVTRPGSSGIVTDTGRSARSP